MPCPMCGCDSDGICSMCYGDHYYGNDGYYLAWLEEKERQHEEFLAMMEEERLMQYEEDE